MADQMSSTPPTGKGMGNPSTATASPEGGVPAALSGPMMPPKMAAKVKGK